MFTFSLNRGSVDVTYSLKTCSVVKMAAGFAVTLSQDDIPGASLEGRHLAELNNDALRFWLKCRGDKCKGMKTKAQLLKR